jgi:hypothetical protein
VLPGDSRRTPAPIENDIGERSQHAHQEAVGVVVACDQLVRPRHGRDRHDAVERGDEVRVDGRVREADVTAVKPRQFGGQLDRRKAGLLQQDVEWLHGCDPRDGPPRYDGLTTFDS